MARTDVKGQFYLPKESSINIVKQHPGDLLLPTVANIANTLPLDTITLHRGFKPLWIAMRLLGTFPITFSKSGEARFQLFSPSLLYTLLVFVFIACYTTFVMVHRVRIIRIADFNTVIFSYKCLLYCVGFWFLPTGHWIGVRKVVNYINNFTRFEAVSHQLTGVPLSLTFASQVKLQVMIQPIFVVIFLCFEWATLDMFFYEAIYYGYMGNLFIFHLFFWHFVCAALADATKYLAEVMTQEMRLRPGDPTVLPKYWQLWEDLSWLIQAMGEALLYVYGPLLGLIFTIITCTAYGFLAECSRENGLVGALGMFFNCVVVSSVLVLFCNAPNLLHNEITKHLIRSVKRLRSANREVQHQLEHFQISLCLDTPNVSLSGYLVVNRALLTTLLAAIVTYLVVLLQFKGGAEQGEGLEDAGRNESLTSQQV